MSDLNPFLLAANIPTPDPRLLPLLRSRPALASAQDSHGYSLLHAAASYSHVDLLRTLVSEFHVDVNLVDEDGETCVFVAETVEVVRVLVEELHIDLAVKNEDDQTAVEKFEAEAEFPEIVTYLRTRLAASTNGVGGGSGDDLSAVNGTQHPPPLPPNVTININTATDVTSEELLQEPDPEFRRRIEELAASERFSSQEGQRELRDLITDAIRGVGNEERDVRRRLG